MSVPEYQALRADSVPSDQRRWVETALIQPLNRFLAPLAQQLRQLALAQLNVQLLEWKGLPPSGTAPVEVISQLSGGCVGLVAVYARALDAGGVAADPVSGLGSPAWVELAATDRGQGNKLRVTAQPGLTAGTRYALKWIALGR